MLNQSADTLFCDHSILECQDQAKDCEWHRCTACQMLLSSRSQYLSLISHKPEKTWDKNKILLHKCVFITLSSRYKTPHSVAGLKKTSYRQFLHPNILFCYHKNWQFHLQKTYHNPQHIVKTMCCGL